jgi:hypothetical protein
MPPGPPQGFSKNVFINCPFDSQYDSLLRPILFTIIYLGYNPQIASQTSDSGEQRINKILSLILKSRLSIHDLSRLKSAKPGEFFRLNMPFELGIDYGCRRIGIEHLRRKRFLVLGEKPHDYKKALSDLGGVDAKSHANQPNKAVLALRNWFVAQFTYALLIVRQSFGTGSWISTPTFMSAEKQKAFLKAISK